MIDFGLAQRIISAFSSSTDDSDFMFTESCSDEKKAAELCLSILKKTTLASKRSKSSSGPQRSALRSFARHFDPKKLPHVRH